MKNTTSVTVKPPQFTPSGIISVLFFIALFGIVLTSKLPTATGPVLFLKKEFLAGRESLFRFQDTGLPYAPFEAYVPKKGIISFLTDKPYDPFKMAAEQLQAAQGRLIPLLLNSAPVEPTAILFCSRDEIAVARIQETGYKPVAALGNGKMMAEKKT